MLRPSPNHGILWLNNDDDDDNETYSANSVTYRSCGNYQCTDFLSKSVKTVNIYIYTYIYIYAYKIIYTYIYIIMYIYIYI